MKKTILFVPFLTVALSASAQNVSVTETTITSNPPDKLRFEKAVGYFTSTAYYSYFLATDQGAYIYDPVSGITITVAIDGTHYERASPYYAAPTDKYQSIIASVGPAETSVSLVAYSNPANSNEGNAQAPWGRYTIYGPSGCHDLSVVDLDGDGKVDVACSGTFNDDDSAAFVMFQNGYNNWDGPYYAAVAGEGIGIIAVNGGARNNLVGCDGASLYWYANPGGAAARSNNWPRYYIGSCTEGSSIAGINIGNRDLVVQASNENDPTVWADGLAYFDPGSNPYGIWTQTILDSTYRDVHQISGDILNGTPFVTVGEQEQASITCNANGYDDHPTVQGCRVALFVWNGNGFDAPVLLSNMGTHNQAMAQLNGVEYIAGANHSFFGAYDQKYNLWAVTINATVYNGGGTPLIEGVYIIWEANGDVWDAGFRGAGDSVMREYTFNDNPNQQFIYGANGTLCSIGQGVCLYDNGGVLTQGQADTFTITPSSGGYTIRDNNTGRYVNPDGIVGQGNAMTLSAAMSVWNISPQ
ncbi:MAG: hypothetical protein JOZ32_10675 [Bryobacterales bacterium]|nr:hypothetical protein [Bryobacterales bacterium]